MKEHILKLIELKPKVGYYDLSMIFGLSIDNLFKLLDIKNYEIVYNTFIELYNNNGKRIYTETSDSYWEKYVYDDNGNNQIYREHSDGWWHKIEYDVNGNKTYEIDSNSLWYKWVYDNKGKLIYFENSSGYKRHY